MQYIANILEFDTLSDEYPITYDNAIEDAFVVHFPKCIVKFKRTPEGMYGWKPPQDFF